MKTTNENTNSREKYITRTITWYTGIQIKANYEKRTFDEVPFTVYDELEVPRNAENVQKHEKLLRMKLSDFIRLAEEIEK